MNTSIFIWQFVEVVGVEPTLTRSPPCLQYTIYSVGYLHIVQHIVLYGAESGSRRIDPCVTPNPNQFIKCSNDVCSLSNK